MKNNDFSENTAYLSNKNCYVIFKYKNKTIRFRGPYSLVRIRNIKEWNHGYVVVDVEYSNCSDIVEDYIDLVPILNNLYINPEEFLNPIRKVELQYV